MRKSQQKIEAETNIRAIIGRWAQGSTDFELVPYSIVSRPAIDQPSNVCVAIGAAGGRGFVMAPVDG